jgi:hypothetical protein
MKIEYIVFFKDIRTGKELAGMRFDSLGELFRFNSDHRDELIQLRMTSRVYAYGTGCFFKV